MNRQITLFLFVFILFSQASAQRKTVRGHVRDAKTQVLLPLANIQIEGTYRGTVSNDDGAYILELYDMPAVLLVRYIGYKIQRIPIRSDSPDVIDIKLTPVPVQMQPVVVVGEDPALSIMRKVIEMKQVWRSNLQTYQADAYTRLVLENDTSIVSIAESVSHLLWDRDAGTREVITSKHETTNIRSEDIFASAYSLPNFYDDDIDVMGFRTVGPTHPDAMEAYHFKIIGERKIDNKTVTDISVIPKSKLQPSLKGMISILDEAYAMIQVDLKPNEAVLFPQPIKKVDFRFRQQFSNFGRAFWVPVDVRIDGYFKIAMVGLEFPNIRFNQISRISDYQINVNLPDSLYKSDDVVTMDTLSIKQDTVFASRPRVIPLTIRESDAYVTLDSTATIEKAFQPTGFLAKMARLRVTSGDGDGEQSSDDSNRGFNPLKGVRPRLGYDRVSGLEAGLGYRLHLPERIELQSGAAYHKALKRWSWDTGLDWRWGRGSVAFRYADEKAVRNVSDLYPLWLNSLTSLFGGGDYHDYLWQAGWRISAGYRFRPIDTRLTVGYSDVEHTSLSRSTDWALYGRSELRRINPPVAEGRMRSVFISLVIGGDFIPWGIVGQNRLALNIEHSPDALSSDFSFTRYRMVWDVHLGTFFRRRILPNALDLRLVAGASSGAPPIQRLGSLDVSRGALSPFGAFRTLRGRSVEGETYWGIFWEHNFRTVPFEVIGLRGLAERGWSILVHGASGRAWLSDQSRAAYGEFVRTLEEVHHEVGLSLSGILGFIRLDVTRRLTGRVGMFVGVSAARLF